MGSGFSWLRTGTGADWWEYANEPSLFWKPGSCWLTERLSVSWKATCQLGGVRHSFVLIHVRTQKNSTWTALWLQGQRKNSLFDACR